MEQWSDVFDCQLHIANCLLFPAIIRRIRVIRVPFTL
jgi:hypothetical protein